ncbi:MAG TPA: sulfotransferase, partial [Candidatus Methylomirabilis sp.]|nr:sulfotransferase [Candidatus Methylomirabilis sp.]
MTGRLCPSADPARRPLDDEAVFVGGLPRSGTSLMRDIIGAHPDVAMFPGELPVTTLLAGTFPAPFPRGGDEIERLVGAFVEHPRVQR